MLGARAGHGGQGHGQGPGRCASVCSRDKRSDTSRGLATDNASWSADKAPGSGRSAFLLGVHNDAVPLDFKNALCLKIE